MRSWNRFKRLVAINGFQLSAGPNPSASATVSGQATVTAYVFPAPVRMRMAWLGPKGHRPTEQALPRLAMERLPAMGLLPAMGRRVDPVAHDRESAGSMLLRATPLPSLGVCRGEKHVATAGTTE